MAKVEPIPDAAGHWKWSSGAARHVAPCPATAAGRIMGPGCVQHAEVHGRGVAGLVLLASSTESSRQIR
eukprot:7934722-Pyramimonas_sp.AAC.1